MLGNKCAEIHARNKKEKAQKKPALLFAEEERTSGGCVNVSLAEWEALADENEKLTDENQKLKKTIEELQEVNASFADDENTIEKLKRENEIQGMRLNYYETHREETEKRRNIIEGTYLNVIREIVLAIDGRCRE